MSFPSPLTCQLPTAGEIEGLQWQCPNEPRVSACSRKLLSTMCTRQARQLDLKICIQFISRHSPPPNSTQPTVLIRHNPNLSPSSLSVATSFSPPQITNPLSAHVRRRINLIRKLRDVHLEPALDLVEDLLIGLARDERNGKALRSETTGASHAVQELIAVIGEVVVDDDWFNRRRID